MRGSGNSCKTREILYPAQKKGNIMKVKKKQNSNR